MKIKSRHLVTGAAIAAAALIAVLPVSMTITEATPERVVIETTGRCSFNLWLYHAPNDCTLLGGPRVISATYFSKGTFYWDAIGLEAPEVGDQVCGLWACVKSSGEFAATVTGPWKVYLPGVYND